MTKCPNALHGDTELDLHGKRAAGKTRWISGGISCQWLVIQPCLPAFGCLLDPTSLSQPAPYRPGKEGVSRVLKPLDWAHNYSTAFCRCLISAPEKGLRWTCGHTQTPCLSGHCYHLSEPGQYHTQRSEAKGVGFAPAQLPGLISMPDQHLTSIGPAINCQRWCSQIPTIQERPVIIPQIQVREDSQFCAEFSLSMPSFVSSHLPYFSARWLSLFHPSIFFFISFFTLRVKKEAKRTPFPAERRISIGKPSLFCVCIPCAWNAAGDTWQTEMWNGRG